MIISRCLMFLMVLAVADVMAAEAPNKETRDC
jgi:hypothetical protein